jgi:modification methylase
MNRQRNETNDFLRKIMMKKNAVVKLNEVAPSGQQTTDNLVVSRYAELPIVKLIDGDLKNPPEILSELASIKPADSRAFSVLEQGILRDGVIDPLVATTIDGKTFLIDGHMRLQVILKHNITNFKIALIELPSVQAAVWWAVEQTYSYRHMNDFVRTEIALKALPCYEKIAKENKVLAGKYKGNLSASDIPFKPIDCLHQVGNDAEVSKGTVSSVKYILKNGKPNEIQDCRIGKTKIHTMHKQVRDRIEATEEWERQRNGAHDDIVYNNPHSNEYYNQVIQGDCIEVLKRMHLDGINNIDLVCFSPPYFGAKRDYGSGFKDFSTYDEYLFWLKEIIYLCHRIGSVGMRLCINVDAMNRQDPKDGEDYQYTVTADLVRMVHDLNAEYPECKLRFFGEFVWFKNHAGGKQALGSFSPMKPIIRNDAESIMVWVKDQKTFENINEKVLDPKLDKPEIQLTKEEYLKYTLKTWTISANNDSYRHPAKFPYEIPYRLIKLLTFPGQVVLDPMCGSGVSLQAAKDLGRKYIGVEQNSSYCQMAQDRLAEEANTQKGRRASA